MVVSAGVGARAPRELSYIQRYLVLRTLSSLERGDAPLKQLSGHGLEVQQVVGGQRGDLGGQTGRMWSQQEELGPEALWPVGIVVFVFILLLHKPLGTVAFGSFRRAVP